MPRISANIGFLWPGLSDPERIRAAGLAGFDAVECHFPYDVDPIEINAALSETGLAMLGLNTRLGKNGAEDFGVAARVGREAEARELIDQAIDYAAAINCQNIHVLAGKTGGGEEAEKTYRSNLTYACEKALVHNKTILIEPINQRSVPDYHMSIVETGIETIEAVGASNLKLMFDCFHTQIMQGDLETRLKNTLPYVGHIQIAAVPDRGEPDQGEVNFPWLLAAIDDMGWEGYIGAEYLPRGSMEDGLGWLGAYKS